MVFTWCFGGGGGDVEVQRSSIDHGAQTQQLIIKETVKDQEVNQLHSGTTVETRAALPPGNATLLSAKTFTDSRIARQLNILSSALASIAGNWYERLTSAASCLTDASGAALCSVSILGAGDDKYTVIYVTGNDAEYTSIWPIGSQQPALQAGTNGSGDVCYNSVQMLQLLQAPLLYSFSNPVQLPREMKQPPCDWQSIYTSRGLSEFCALPLIHEKAVMGAVTLTFSSPVPPVQQSPEPTTLEHLDTGGPVRQQPAVGMTADLMSCDEHSLRTLGLILSVLLAGQDLQLAQQVGDVLAGVHGARNLQQVVTAITAGAERILQLKTRVSVAVTLALLPGSAPGASGRVIIFEERGSRFTASSYSTGGIGGDGASRSLASGTELQGHGSQGPGWPGLRSKVPRTNLSLEGFSSPPGNGVVGGPQQQQQQGLSPLGRANGAGSLGSGLGGCLTSSHDSVLPAPVSQGSVLWQASSVQARALSLRHTLFANLPSGGTVVHDCPSYMQQVGCPKRDLYLLSSSRGTPPFSLAIAPAPLPLHGTGANTNVASSVSEGSAQLVLYAAVATRLPLELLNEILVQAQQLATRVLAPLLGQRLMQGGLADEWSLLVGKCSSGRVGAGGFVAVGTPGKSESQGNLRTSKSEIMSAAGGAGEMGTHSICSAGDTQGSITQSGSRGSDVPAGNNAPASRTEAGGGSGGAPQSTSAHANGNDAVAVTPAADARNSPGRLLSGMDISLGAKAMVLSTALAGTFAGDTRTHMGMLVSSFKDTINRLQARRDDEPEELSVLKLGKVLGRGGSGLVFQGYLHMGLEVAVKLFENPDDSDPDLGSSSEHMFRATTLNLEESSVGTEGAAGSVTMNGPADAVKESASAQAGVGGGGTAARMTAGASKTSAQMTKRQRDLIRNALELGVTSSLSHPNIVQGYCHWVNVVLMQDASLNRCWLMGHAEYMALAPPGSPPPPLCSALVMEYCDMGSLVHALKRGTFSTADGKPNMEFVYMCLLEIALALRHLHAAMLAHCDLKPGNVLLRSSPRDPRGFVCKLGDFGYAAILKEDLLPGRPAVLPDEACGTLQYMAPELFVAGRPVDASIDIYAFGMLMWELTTGRTPYSESDYPSRSLMKAVYHGKRPNFPENTLSAYKNLAMCCWSGDPNLRPSAAVLVKLLRQQLESLKTQGSTASSSSTAGSRA